MVNKRIVVLGDSHAQQYMAALGPIAGTTAGKWSPC